MKTVGALLVFVWLLFGPVKVQGAEMPDLTDMQEAGDTFLDENRLDMGGIFARLLKGEDPLSALEVEGQAQKLWEDFLDGATRLLRQVLLLVLFSAVFRVLSGIVEDKRIGETGFYILFMILSALLIRDFSAETQKLGELLDNLCSFMQIASATCSLVILSAGGPVSASFFEQGMMLLITVTQWVIGRVFLPVIQCTVLLTVFDQISERRLLSDLGDLMEKFVLWGMKTVMAAVTGVQILRNMLAPAFDTLKRSALGKAAEAIPGVGSIAGSAMEVLLASAVLIRSCLGVVILLVLISGSLSPLLHMVLKCAVFYVMAAFGQPVADKRIVGCIRAVARGYGLCVRILSGTILLFFLAIAVMAQIG